MQKWRIVKTRTNNQNLVQYSDFYNKPDIDLVYREDLGAL